MPRVFISYAHESDQQREQVAVLARRLREEGVEAWIDQFVEDDPPYWPTWMPDQIEQADYVLCVVSRAYEERFESKERMERGRGVNWEGLMMTEAAYADLPRAHRKFIVIAFDPADLQHVPHVLLGAGRTAYLLYDYYHRLYRRITGQAQTVPPVGEIKQVGQEASAGPISRSTSTRGHRLFLCVSSTAPARRACWRRRSSNPRADASSSLVVLASGRPPW